MKNNRKNKNSHTFIAIVATALVVLVATGAGLYIGGKFQNNAAVPPVEADTLAKLKMTIGQPFPDLTVLDTLFESHQSRSLLDPQGTIVVFTDNDCEPCGDISAHWNRLIKSGELRPEQVVGITFDDAGSLQTYLRGANNRFETYSDEAFGFINEYGVSAFPLVFVVGKDGFIKEIYDDSRFEPTREFIETAFLK